MRFRLKKLKGKGRVPNVEDSGERNVALSCGRSDPRCKDQTDSGRVFADRNLRGRHLSNDYRTSEGLALDSRDGYRTGISDYGKVFRGSIRVWGWLDDLEFGDIPGVLEIDGGFVGRVFDGFLRGRMGILEEKV